MDEIFEYVKIENIGIFHIRSNLKITVIFSNNLYLQIKYVITHKFMHVPMHVEKKANQDFARF